MLVVACYIEKGWRARYKKMKYLGNAWISYTDNTVVSLFLTIVHIKLQI